MNATTKIETITYTTAAGEMTVTYDRPFWLVNDNGTAHVFESVPQWMAYARENHGWPLALKAV